MAKIKAEEIIISHPGTDFDSLASMVAASKLYPNAKLVLITGMDIGVREFYALYRDHFPIIQLRQVDTDSVKRVIITDTSKLSRLRNIREILKRDGIEVHLYDHHIEEEGEFTADFNYCLPYGSTTTILIMEIIKRAIKLSPEEATLCILGIYEDTGNLTFSTTTTHDMDAAKYLLNAGANLSVVRRYISHQMGPEQMALMQKLILNTRDMVINSVRVFFSTAKIADYVDEIAFITGKIQDLENADAIFTLVEVRGRVYIVGRSRIAPVNIAHILSYYGGGGHPSAGSAMVPHAEHHRILQGLIAILREELKPYVTAGDIMSRPVRTIAPESTIEECREMMIQLGHSGLVVTEDEKMVGIISRRDVDRAILSGYSLAPVKGYMQRDVISAGENTGLYQLEKIIIRNNVGRIPILFGERVTGIVTRSDIIQALHRMAPVGDEEMEELPIDGTLMQEDIFRSLPREVLNVLINAGRVADRVKLPVYLVGGIVRDILMGRHCADIDFVVEGNAAIFAEALGQDLGRRVELNMRFGTAKIHFEHGGTIDIAGTRQETYEQPGALPEVEPGNITDDLKRRDFTINSIAVRINHSAFGEFLDPLNGRRDIEHGIIRILHDKSFEDDPTRIFRAIRFASRFEFTIENHTLSLIRDALADGMLQRITNQRIRDEIWLILKDSNPISALKMLDDIGALKKVHPKLELPEHLMGPVDPVRDVVNEYASWGLPYALRAHQIYLCLLMWDFKQADVDAFSEDFQLAGNDEETIRGIPNFRWEMRELTKIDRIPLPSEIYDNLHWVQVEHCLAYLIIGESLELRDAARRFIREIRPTKLDINGQDLKDMGFPPSRAYKRAFQAVFRAKIDGKVSGRQEELEMAEDVLRSEMTD